MTALLDQLMQLGRAEQALRHTAPPSGACSDISPSHLSPQHSTVSSFPSPCFTAFSFLPSFSFWDPSPLSLPPPSSLCMMWLDRRIQIYVFLTRASHFFWSIWLLISPHRWVSLSSLLPLSLTFPLLPVRHSLLSCCETFMLFHTVKGSLSCSLDYISSMVLDAF